MSENIGVNSLTIFSEISDGVQTVYPMRFSLRILDKGSIYVYAGEHSEYENQLLYTWVDDNHIELAHPLPAGERFWVRRVVNRKDLDYYFTSSSINPRRLDDAHLQLLMVSQEIMDGFADPYIGAPPLKDKIGDKLNGTPLQHDEIWLVDTSEGVLRHRPLPAPGSRIPLGRRIVIRDATGNASAGSIEIQGNGNTIAGEHTDLVITRDWAWVQLVYKDVDTWEVEQGGVGASIRPDRAQLNDLVWPVGVWLFSSLPLNPSVYLHAGVWKRVSEGRVPIGVGTAIGENAVTRTVSEGSKTGNFEVSLQEENIPRMAFTIPRVGTQTVSHGESADTGVYGVMGAHVGVSNPLAVNVAQPSEAVYVWERIE